MLICNTVCNMTKLFDNLLIAHVMQCSVTKVIYGSLGSDCQLSISSETTQPKWLRSECLEMSFTECQHKCQPHIHMAPLVLRGEAAVAELVPLLASLAAASFKQPSCRMEWQCIVGKACQRANHSYHQHCVRISLQ